MRSDGRRRGQRRQCSILAAVRISKTSGRDMLTGLFRFVEENPGWLLRLVQYDGDFTPEVVRGAPGKGHDGIIATFPGAAGTVEAIAKSPLPVVLVNVRGAGLDERGAPTAFIRDDNAAIGRLAANWFVRNGNYASFAFVPKSDDDWCVERCGNFVATLSQNGRMCEVFKSLSMPGDPSGDEKGLAEFLIGLPKPAAVYAASDECALKVLAAAHEAGIKIPEQMSLMGTDNDEFLVRHSDPPVTSILPDHVKTGFRAAMEMKKLMTRRSGPKDVIYIPPVSVIERTSTRPVLPVTVLVKMAKAYIDAHACERIKVADVVGHLGVSRRLAELRFAQMEGMSIRRAIESRRMEAVKRLLRKTKLPVTEIAARTGFSGLNRLSHVFKARFGVSPENWREKCNDVPSSKPEALRKK